MNRNPAADTRTPWREAAAPSQTPAPRWLPGTALSAPAANADAVSRPAEAPEDNWATEALFDYYNA
jgi:hypothetical protein